MSTKTNLFLKVLNVISWIIFVGLCFEAGTFIFNAILLLFIRPADTSKFWLEVNLTELHHANESYYVTLISLMIIATVLKAILFYIIVKLFYDKNFNLSQPFNETMRRFILNAACLALGVGFFSFWGSNVAKNFILQGIKMPDVEHLRFGGADVWLFMGITLLVIAQIFKKGIEIQNENDLTI